jgi:hypothetical protein
MAIAMGARPAEVSSSPCKSTRAVGRWQIGRLEKGTQVLVQLLAHTFWRGFEQPKSSLRRTIPAARRPDAIDRRAPRAAA